MSEFFLKTIWWIPLYPLMGAILSIPWSPGIIRKTGPRPAGYLNILMTFIAFLHGLFALNAIWGQPAQKLIIPYLQVVDLDFSIPLEISTVTLGATLVITGLNLLAQIYAIGYMEMDWGWARFYCLLGLFEGGLSALVLCDSLFYSYIVLEILTLGTYLLVGFWFNQSLVVTGARDAFLTKRVGDLFLLMGVVALYPLAGTWNFSELAEWAQTANIDPKIATLLGLTLLAGPMGKCAQFPLHLWLDEAMEGPVPSTILRNAVVVASGAWVLVKLEPVLALSPTVMSTAVFVGLATALGASLIAMAQIDIKRAISYSVSSYMGIAFVAVGTGHADITLLLLLTYSFAMALLVMSTGGIILNNITQDLTQYGGLWSRRPISGLCFIVGIFALIAMPPFGGFWTLQALIENLWTTEPAIVVVLLMINSLTAFSLTREFGLIFAGKPKQMTVRSPEGLWALVLPMTFLAGFCLHIPLLLANWNLLPEFASLDQTVAGVLLLSSLAGCGLGCLIYVNDNWQKPVQLGSKAVQDFFAYDFYTAKLYRLTIIAVVASVSQVMSWVDRYLVDGVVNLVGFATLFSGQSLRYNVTGQTQFYALTIVLGIAAILAILAYGLF
ncbi:MAG: NAD(P)H-quinone oxidoreductase subunit F [Limnoraphis robusta]|uniref:NAD(P)H-quinone oxidoreductase subunit F n=2 Tax=Limnoraphis robusta TaxID=1118279 RepID=A0A0F5YIQ0_9CYAN|nr:NAD(P)H-quinone oxidoreductase subunit F [Limnoraphis robusta]KKD38804.1 NAD(P)H-quinone oxidoreductase subunit F [Limnoraphis robusta CS-951]MEA5498905.1 NAD(P)H-quinone oxidoreductase subunit F [Limnoraphis robusta BA-68 BA1]MEA5521810.1 NAD(P)H-quinone oxidoreductase subunit F [Limnoraphis robusta CCNP1315]MEA5543994.1 NAD(P)H-quinone oxidoreductase subunit F [Limnoraphis robusta CCNP1324]